MWPNLRLLVIPALLIKGVRLLNNKTMTGERANQQASSQSGLTAIMGLLVATFYDLADVIFVARGTIKKTITASLAVP